MNSILRADIAVIGGGASGLAAAIGALQANKFAKVVIAERLDKTGRKILATGSGRCNLSNKNLSESAYHGSLDVMKIIEKTPNAEEFFLESGIICTTDEQGRIYPNSNSAASILSALRLRALKLGVIEVCGFKADKIEIKTDGFIIHSEYRIIYSKKIIIAAGGYAAPSFGTDGSMMRILKNMGYKTKKICPAIAPLKVKTDLIKGLRGVRVKGKISAVSNGKILRTETGEIQFTENTISGICVFNLAYLMSEYEGKLILRADFMPAMTVEELEEYLCCIQYQRYECTVEELLTGIFVKNLAVYLVKRILKRSLSDKISALKYNEIRNMAEKIKSLEFEISGCSSWQNAQATSGGIHGSCVDDKLQSKLHPGIYFAGEILDVDGDCGGFNLQWAWSSGLWSGKNCAESLKQEKVND